MVGLDTFVQMYAAKKAAEKQEEGIKDWQERLNELVAGYGTADEDYLWTYVDPLADPAMTGLTNEIMLMLGQPGAPDTGRGGPKAQAMSMASAMGYGVPGDETFDEGYAKAAKSLGFKNKKALKRAQEEWEAQQAEWASQTEGTRQDILQGRLGGYQNLAQMLQDFPVPTEQGFQDERGVQFQALMAEIDLARKREQERILESANTGNYNPAGILGMLSDRMAVQEAQAQANSISRALEIITGKTAAAGNAISSLQSGLLPAVQAGGNLAQLRSGALGNVGGIAANQANTFNQIQSAEETTRLLSQLGFPSELLLGMNAAELAATQGAIMGESLDVSRDIQDFVSILSAVKGTGGTPSSAAQPYNSPVNNQGGSTQPWTGGTANWNLGATKPAAGSGF